MKRYNETFADVYEKQNKYSGLKKLSNSYVLKIIISFYYIKAS